MLVTLDVSSLYTNIPNQEDMIAAANALLNAGPALDMITIPSPMTLLRMILTLKIFEFNGEHYLPTGSTSMSTRLALSYGNLFMANFEEIHVYTHPQQPWWWKRYIDDIYSCNGL